VSAPVSVIVPVYRGIYDLTLCLESVVRHARGMQTEFELVLIDDATPEPAVRTYLEGFVTRSLPFPVTLLTNPENLGFVGTVKRGLRRAPGDVVILNADTALTAGWLDRLAAVASEIPDVATVTPVTSSGSLCTLPQSVIDEFGLWGPNPQVDECAEFVINTSLRMLPEVITGVGFCMYVTRRALELCGLLDEETFGKGYGEEVDFCLRATRLGLRHVVDDATFVYHRGGGSFGDQQSEGLARGSRLLDERYPYFRPTNLRERAQDPSQISFAALELGLHERDPGRAHVLHIMHSAPGDTGGTEKFLDSLMSSLRDEFDFSVFYPVSSGFALQTQWVLPDGSTSVERFFLPGGPRHVTRITDEVAGAALQMALDMFSFDAVHVHNLIGHSLAALGVLVEFDGPVLCSVHDLFLTCPNFSLLYRKVEPCGIPDDLSSCDRCLAVVAEAPMPGSPMITNLSRSYLTEFRSTVAANIDAVDHWVFAAQSTADYFTRVYEPEPGRMEIIEHGSVIRLGRRAARPDRALIYDEPLRVAFVGLGWAKKGLDAVNSLADAFRDSSIEIHHFGDLRQAASPELHAHGAYDNEFLPELLQRAGIQIVLLPGPYAETFGIVMSEALATGIPVIGAYYGALGERIRAHGVGWTIDPMDHEEIRALIERLDRARDEVLRATQQVLEVKLETVADTSYRYAALYRDGARPDRDARDGDSNALTPAGVETS
jgi:GT2 family glycosyltransferase/glycosyltransferase involved in cell wall biosynthesis